MSDETTTTEPTAPAATETPATEDNALGTDTPTAAPEEAVAGAPSLPNDETATPPSPAAA